MYGHSPGVKNDDTSRSADESGAKLASVPGTMMIVWAKMIGITLAVRSRTGMKVFFPSWILPRPITFRGTWIGMRRDAMVIDTVSATTPRMMIRYPITPSAETTLVWTYWTSWMND